MLLKPKIGLSNSRDFAELANSMVTLQEMIDTWCFPPKETCRHAFAVAIVWLGSGKLIQEKNCQIISAAIQGLVNESMFTPK